MEGSGACGIHCPAVPRPRIVDRVLGHQQAHRCGVVCTHIHRAGGFIVGQFYRAVSGNRKQSILKKDIHIISVCQGEFEFCIFIGLREEHLHQTIIICITQDPMNLHIAAVFLFRRVKIRISVFSRHINIGIKNNFRFIIVCFECKRISIGFKIISYIQILQFVRTYMVSHPIVLSIRDFNRRPFRQLFVKRHRLFFRLVRVVHSNLATVCIFVYNIQQNDCMSAVLLINCR